MPTMPRRGAAVLRNASLAALAALLWLAAAAAYGRALEIHRIVLAVSDLDRSVAFYESALGFRKVDEALAPGAELDPAGATPGLRVPRATLRLGDEAIELEQHVAPAGVRLSSDTRAQDLWFQHFAIVVRDMDAAYTQLARQPIPIQAISSAPQTLPESNVAAAGIRAYKFKDPDGHPLELLYFPPGKGNPKWQRGADALFLGIDHSAITVADTARSVRFWGDLVGLVVAGGSLNSGPTQEHLDGATGAVVRVTGLRPQRARGPGLEFLQYLAPSDGRPAAAGAAPGDIAQVHVVLEVDDLDCLVERLPRSSAHPTRPRPVRVGGTPFALGVMVTDPDGHAALLVQR
jgi:catechol 2,3-dioxygenase-like lactoylglutathione lyase family enzyme